jgi:hypothetical protein
MQRDKRRTMNRSEFSENSMLYDYAVCCGGHLAKGVNVGAAHSAELFKFDNTSIVINVTLILIPL